MLTAVLVPCPTVRVERNTTMLVAQVAVRLVHCQATALLHHLISNLISGRRVLHLVPNMPQVHLTVARIRRMIQVRHVIPCMQFGKMPLSRFRLI